MVIRQMTALGIKPVVAQFISLTRQMHQLLLHSLLIYFTHVDYIVFLFKMPPKYTQSSADQLLEALKSDAIVEALTKSLLPAVTLAVQEVMQKELTSLKSALDMLIADNKELKNRVSMLDVYLSQLKIRSIMWNGKIDSII